jgi:hypothetical protein
MSKVWVGVARAQNDLDAGGRARVRRQDDPSCERFLETPTLSIRFWSKVKKGEGKNACWERDSCVSSSGYGKYRWRGQMRSAHRVSWELVYGPIPSGALVLHSCDKKSCVRPGHLFLGDQQMAHAGQASPARKRPKGPGRVRGARHHSTSLSEDNIREIRLRAAGEESGTSLAKEFGITRQAMSLIILRKTWKHVRKTVKDRPS